MAADDVEALQTFSCGGLPASSKMVVGHSTVKSQKILLILLSELIIRQLHTKILLKILLKSCSILLNLASIFNVDAR